MKTINLKAESRKVSTKGELNQLRKNKFVPGNIYGGNTNVQIKIDERALNKILYTPDAYLVHLEVDGKTYSTIIKETQFHKVTDRPIHIDFQIVEENKPIKTFLPVKTKGQAEGVKAGGKLNISLRKVLVKGLIKDIPDELELDITNLGVGKTITCGDVQIPNVTLLHPSNLSIVSVNITRNVIEGTPQTATATSASAPGTPAAESQPAPAAQPSPQSSTTKK